MLSRLPSKKAGFTLVEVLILIFAISFLSITSLLAFLNSNRALDFISAFNELRSEIRAPRSYAINNKIIDDSIPPNYGVYIGAPKRGKQSIIVFADNGGTQYTYDPPGSNFPDKIMTDGEVVIDTEEFTISASTSSGELKFPLTLFYKSGSATLDSFENGNVYIPKDLQKYIAIKFSSVSDVNLMKYLVIFQVSGLSEEATQLPESLE